MEFGQIGVDIASEEEEGQAMTRQMRTMWLLFVGLLCLTGCGGQRVPDEVRTVLDQADEIDLDPFKLMWPADAEDSRHGVFDAIDLPHHVL